MFHIRMQKEKPKQHHDPAEQRSQGFIFEEYEEFGMCGVELTGSIKLQGDSQMYRGMSLNLLLIVRYSYHLRITQSQTENKQLVMSYLSACFQNSKLRAFQVSVKLYGDVPEHCGIYCDSL